jgi:hypothetical protein
MMLVHTDNIVYCGALFPLKFNVTAYTCLTGPPGMAAGGDPVTGTACRWKLVKSLPTMHRLGSNGVASAF